jgi:hypothetical protein
MSRAVVSLFRNEASDRSSESGTSHARCGRGSPLTFGGRFQHTRLQRNPLKNRRRWSTVHSQVQKDSDAASGAGKKGSVHGVREELSWRSGVRRQSGACCQRLKWIAALSEFVRRSFSSISVPVLVSRISLCRRRTTKFQPCRTSRQSQRPHRSRLVLSYVFPKMKQRTDDRIEARVVPAVAVAHL